MQSLVEALPRLGELFELHRKIGEGTFSTVFLGSLRSEGSGEHGEDVREKRRRLFAIKHLVPTVHPNRVEHELRCLKDIGGQDHVIGVELCLRQMDTVVLVMPYIPHRKFSEYVVKMDANETRSYVRALLLALRRVHQFGVIHRDVKPSNFLYDRENQRYLLVDFGLAQRIVNLDDKHGDSKGGARGAVAGGAASRKRPAEEYWSVPAAKRTMVAPSCPAPLAPLKHLQADHPKLHHTQKKTTAADRMKLAAARRRMVWESERSGGGGGGNRGCACAGRGCVCSRCLARPAARAARAGTQGFRPPEVLLKYPHQTSAVDMWACGVILLSVLSGRYPFFRASDDASALAEFVSLFGTKQLQRVAHQLGRQLTCSVRQHAVCVRKLCARLRSRVLVPAAPALSHPLCCRCRLPESECVCYNDTVPAPDAEWCGFPDAAFDLLTRLLDLNPHTRITAQDALQHPFLHT